MDVDETASAQIVPRRQILLSTASATFAAALSATTSGVHGSSVANAAEVSLSQEYRDADDKYAFRVPGDWEMALGSTDQTNSQSTRSVVAFYPPGAPEINGERCVSESHFLFGATFFSECLVKGHGDTSSPPRNWSTLVPREARRVGRVFSRDESPDATRLDVTASVTPSRVHLPLSSLFPATRLLLWIIARVIRHPTFINTHQHILTRPTTSSVFPSPAPASPHVAIAQ